MSDQVEFDYNQIQSNNNKARRSRTKLEAEIERGARSVASPNNQNAEDNSLKRAGTSHFQNYQSGPPDEHYMMTGGKVSSNQDNIRSKK